jgi:hypothetical protein
VSDLGELYWKGAELTVKVGDDATPAPTFPLLLKATVSASEVADGALTLTIGDLSTALNKPIAPDTFKGTGGVEGADIVLGRVKRRSFGTCYNVEGLILDPAYLIYEFGDPFRPFASIDRVYDRGRAGPIQIVAWQGTVDATLAALRNAVVPAGGGVVAPSIACVKWWTTPGLLTADISGERYGGQPASAPHLANLLASSGGMVVANVFAAHATRSGIVGLHCADSSETIAAALDRLLIGVSLFWVLNPEGTIRLGAWSFDSAVDGEAIEELTSDVPKRRVLYAPIKGRKLGYRVNNRVMNDGEIASVLLATDTFYPDGTPVAELQPAEAGATNGAPTGSPIGDRLAEEVVADIDLNAQAIIDEALKGDIRDQYLLARTTLEGKDVGTYIGDFRQEVIDSDSALATKISLLGVVSADGKAFLIDLGTVRTGPNETFAQRLSSLSAATGVASGEINDLREILIGPTGSIVARAVLEVTANGRVSGFRNTNTGDRSSFYILADEFGIVQDENGVPFIPFKVVDGKVITRDLYTDRLTAGSVVTANIVENQVTKSERWQASWAGGIGASSVIPSGGNYGLFGEPGNTAKVIATVNVNGAEVTINWNVNAQRTGSNDDQTSYRLKRTDQNGTVQYIGDVLRAGMGDFPGTSNWPWTDTGLTVGVYTYEMEARIETGGGIYYNAKMIGELGKR